MSSEGTAAEYGTHNLIAIYLLSKPKKKTKKQKNKKQKTKQKYPGARIP